jgi:hypothetical protein
MNAAATELALLQTVRLKGRMRRDELTGRAAGGPDVEALIDAGLLLDGPTVRLTAAGRSRLEELLRGERATVDAAAAQRVYADFGVVNAEVKVVIARWQQSRGTADEDTAGVLARIDDLHRAALAVIAAAGSLVPRLATYAARLDNALRLAKGGDPSWLTRPMVDSYHTVWFELHEELIGLAGRTRADGAGT